ncbi:MAG: universal stress protein [Deltaproteobacteria bacterium]|nr:universal stress protein [Deltaproteobacteria bacterium]
MQISLKEDNVQSILVATDFSDCAGAAFRMARRLARTFKSRIVVLHVIHQRRVEAVAQFQGVEAECVLPALRERAQQQLTQFLAGGGDDGLEIASMVAVGLPFQEIAVIARDLAVDLVVMGGYGKSGRGPIEEVFFGSTAEKVVRLLPCPVLCVPLEETAEK